MKGTIEFSQGAVLYILLMLLVVFIGLMIVTKGQLTLIFERGELSRTFGPSQFQMWAGSERDKQLFSKSSAKIECNGAFTLKDISFDYYGSGGKIIKFIVVLDAGMKPVVGRTSSMVNIFECTKKEEKRGSKYDCSKDVDIIFDGVPGDAVLHFTVWRDDGEIIGKIGSPTSYTFSQLVDDYSQNYLGSHDLLGLTVNEACAKQRCPRLGVDECDDDTECWRRLEKRGFLEIPVCYGCEKSRTCGKYKHKDECSKCSQYSGINCKWLPGASTPLFDIEGSCVAA